MAKLLLDKHKLHWHPDVISKFLKGEIFPPISVEISPASRCNQKCKHCYTTYLMEPEISPALLNDRLYFKAIKDSADFGVKSFILCGTGEPTLHPQTPNAISYAKKLGLDVCMITNGILATKERMESCLGDLTFIRFSTAGGSPKRYAELQGSTEEAFYQMLDNLRDLVEIKRRKNLDTTIGVSYPLFEGCQDEIVPFVAELKNIGVDYVQLKPCGDFKKCNYVYKKDTHREEIVAEKLREAEQFTSNDFYCQVKYERFRYLEEVEQIGLPEKCWGLLFYTQIGTDGKVYACSGSWYEEENCYGSLEHNTLKEIWDSERFKEVFERRSIVDKDLCFYQCRNIVGNAFLMQLKNSPAHINFF